MTAVRARRTPSPTAGARLVEAVTSRYDLEAHEEVILTRAARLADVCEALEAVIARDGVTITTAEGYPRVHPAVVEHKNAASTLARLIASLRLPEDVGGDGRPARRGARGFHASPTVIA